MYTFYCCKPDGSAATFEAHLLAGDDAAAECAERLVRQHASCAYVAAFEADREVLQVQRPARAAAKPAPAISIARTGVDPATLARVLGASAARHPSVALIATTLEGVVVFWDAGAAQIYGWREDEAIGRNIVELTPALQSRAEASTIMAQLQTGQPWRGEIALRNRDGAPFLAYVVDLPIGVGADRGLIVGASAPARSRKAVEACQTTLQHDLRQAFGA